MTEFLVLHRMGVVYRMALVDAETTDDAITRAEYDMTTRDHQAITEIRSIPVSAMVETIRTHA